MRKILISLILLPLAACGGDVIGGDLSGGDTTGLSEEEKNQASAMLNQIDFGDDSSDWANDGECDDPRFRGPGMTTTPLLDEDEKADKTDCLAAYKNGELILKD